MKISFYNAVSKGRPGLLAVFVVLFLALLAGAGASVSYFRTDTPELENAFLPMAVNIAVVENGNAREESRENGFTSGSAKTVCLQNKEGTEQVSAYLRCALVPVWRNEKGQNASLAMQSPVLTKENQLIYSCADGSELCLVLDENWKQNWKLARDGWFYYQGAVAPGAVTAPLLQSADFNTKTAALELQVLADGVQAEGSGQPDWVQNCYNA